MLENIDFPKTHPVGSVQLMEEIGEPPETATDESFNRGFEKGVVWASSRVKLIGSVFDHLVGIIKSETSRYRFLVLFSSIPFIVATVFAQLGFQLIAGGVILFALMSGLFSASSIIIEMIRDGLDARQEKRNQSQRSTEDTGIKKE